VGGVYITTIQINTLCIAVTHTHINTHYIQTYNVRYMCTTCR